MRAHGINGPLPGLLTPKADGVPIDEAKVRDVVLDTVSDVVKRAQSQPLNGNGHVAPTNVAVDASLTPLIEWLAIHGSTWTQADAERWFKAFTATVDLVYPTRAAA